ncbi:hypothetical protein T492DRAFT_1077393 [Pavlovales sp. CCMP2436]|nr:hypothetical protein T492DRAFT_1077393 [Pavlovales sp. CCMP2436]
MCADDAVRSLRLEVAAGQASRGELEARLAEAQARLAEADAGAHALRLELAKRDAVAAAEAVAARAQAVALSELLDGASLELPARAAARAAAAGGASIGGGGLALLREGVDGGVLRLSGRALFELVAGRSAAHSPALAGALVRALQLAAVGAQLRAQTGALRRSLHALRLEVHRELLDHALWAAGALAGFVKASGSHAGSRSGAARLAALLAAQPPRKADTYDASGPAPAGLLSRPTLLLATPSPLHSAERSSYLARLQPLTRV